MEKRKVSSIDFCIKLVVSFLFLTMWFLLFLDDYKYDKALSIFGSVLLLIISALSFIKARKKLSLMIVFALLFYFNYSIVYYFYLKDNTGAFFATFAHTSAAMTGLVCLLLFNLIIYLFLPSKIEEAQDVRYIKEENNNPVLVLGTVVVCLFILVFAYTRPTVDGQRGSVSTIYEYSIILFVVGFYYCGRQKALRYCLIGVLLLIALQNLIYGGRVTALQLFIVLLLTNFPKINKKLLVIGVIVVFVWMIGVGAMRASFSFSGITDAITETFKGGLALDTAYAAYHASMTFFKVEEIASFSQKMYLFGRWLLSIPFGGAAISDSNLSTYTTNYYMHYGGGLLPTYMYFYLGYIGVILISLWVVWYLRRIMLGKVGALGKSLAIYFVSTMPRWYLYSPSQLFRGLLLFIIVYALFKLVHNILTGDKI